MEDLVYVNGDYFSKKEAKISVFDSGFLYGDGLFETIRIYNGYPFLFKEHVKRILKSAGQIGIRDLPLLEEFIHIYKNIQIEKKDGSLKIIITRGKSNRASILQGGKPSVVMYYQEYKPIQKLYKDGVKLSLISENRSKMAYLKSLNYLPNLIARGKETNKGCFEVIYHDDDGKIKEGSMSNIFFVSPKLIVTPNLGEHVLAGITRNFILNILPEVGLHFQEKDINLKDLPEFNEAFITNSLIEVLPVVSLGKIVFKTKKVSHLLHGSYKKKVEEAKKFSLN